MTLEPGTYTIKAKEKDQFVGRGIEDRSYAPKRILALDNPPEDPVWTLGTAGADTFILSTRDNYTAKMDDLVFAILTDIPPPTEWKVEAQSQMGEDNYTITCDGGEGLLAWTVPTDDDPEPQVGVKHLIMQPSFPPRFPANQLFVIKKVE